VKAKAHFGGLSALVGSTQVELLAAAAADMVVGLLFVSARYVWPQDGAMRSPKEDKVKEQ
jgi:hypothetical protein